MDDLDVSLLEQVQDDQRINIQTVINHSQERNNELISEKINQINAWADDKIEATQLKVEEMRTQRKELQRQSDSAVNMIESAGNKCGTVPNVDAGAGNSCPTSNRRSSYSRVLLMICVKHRK